MRTAGILAALLGMSLLALAGCHTSGPTQAEAPGADKTRVREELEGLQQGLRAGTWSRVERYFSPAYYEGYGELRSRVEEQMRRQTLLDLQFDVLRVLETDGLVNVQVRWRKSWIDNASGVTRKAEGLSEFILKPAHNGRYRILMITGDRLF